MEVAKLGPKCTVEGCENPATGEASVWWPPVITLKVSEPLVMKNIPLCAEHLAEFQEIGVEEFLKKHPLKVAL